MSCVHSQGCSEAMRYNIGEHDQKHLGFITHLIFNLFMVVVVRTIYCCKKNHFMIPTFSYTIPASSQTLPFRKLWTRAGPEAGRSFWGLDGEGWHTAMAVMVKRRALGLL